jgi:hypothetical protein
MTEVKYNKAHPAGGTPEARIASRLKNSGAGAAPDVTTQQGNSAQRVFHNIHHSGSVGGTKVDDREKGGR